MVWKPPKHDPNKKIKPEDLVTKGPAIMPKKKLTEEEVKKHINLFNKISYSVYKNGINWDRGSSS
jgi:hypothetical protein